MVIITEHSKVSSSSPTSDHKYDVFLSFRGIDTRYSFTDHLHKALLDANIDTFLDDEEIQTGEDLKPELESAIKASRASVIVLSKNYASSAWCLDELVLILELRRTSNHIVIPIFYHVEPTDVRKQQRSFEDALAKHKHRMEAETDAEKRNQQVNKMELWKRALVEVSDLKGMNANGWRETMFIEEIVKKISSRLDLCLHSKTPRLIGMRSSVNTITSWLEDGSSHTIDILTIWGMAGIGKTSLAKYVYELHYRDFERSSFIGDIERSCEQQVSTLLDLQKHLLEDIQKGNILKLHDVNTCTIKLEKALLSKRTFLVLDGIDNYRQLDVLVGTKGFHPGSKIIITTKDGSLTEKCGLFGLNVLPKHTKHLLEGLNETESLKLLSWHAFRCNGPKDAYEEGSRKVVKYCGGHPLALEVLGSSLYKEDIVAWEATLELLEKELNPHVQKVLQISFDSLPSNNDKELFKHIACFFIGKDREFAGAILRECGMNTTFGFSKLIDRCLLAIGPKNKLMMHQLLQELGRGLVRQESPEKPWKRSRLCHHEESYDVLKREKGTARIQGLVFDMKMFENDTAHGTSSSTKEIFGDDFRSKFGELSLPLRVRDVFSRIWCLFAWVFLLCSSHRNKLELETNAFSKMDKLRLLQLNYVQLHGSYKHFPKGLRWLSMHGFRSSYVPVDLQMENMVALDMSYSKLQHLWKKPKLLRSLKFLILSCCHELVSVGHFSGFPLLERLILAGCVSLIEVCESIGNCDRLLLLDMSGCNRLKKLPRSIGKLENLRTLSIDGCSNLGEFSAGMKDIESLEVLKANNINIKSEVSSFVIVEAIPRSLKSFAISLPSSLVRLSLTNNNLSNKSFPVDFGSLSMLQELNLDENPIDYVPDCVRSLSTLEFLSLRGCHRLKTVLCAPSTIRHLSTVECHSLEKITFHPEMSTPPILYYLDIPPLTEIEGIFKMEAIADIDEEILCSLGWINIDHVKDHKLRMMSQFEKSTGKVLPVQMLYEFGIFTTFFQGKELPYWITHRSSLPSIHFTLRSSGKSCKIQGLNVCVVTTDSSNLDVGFSTIILRNLTKKCTWAYCPRRCVVPESNEEGIVWLSHWMLGKNEFEDDDEVSVGVVGGNYVLVKEWGINLVYDDGKKKEDPLGYYKSWNQIIGRDLSAFQVESTFCLLDMCMIKTCSRVKEEEESYDWRRETIVEAIMMVTAITDVIATQE